MCTILIMLSSVHPSLHHKRHLDRFGVFSTAHGSGSPILYNIGRPFSPQNCLFVWGIWTPSNTWFPWAHRSSHPKCHLDRFSRFCTAHGRVKATDRPTDRARYSVCSNRPHLRSTVMRPNNMKLQGQWPLVDGLLFGTTRWGNWTEYSPTPVHCCRLTTVCVLFCQRPLLLGLKLCIVLH